MNNEENDLKEQYLDAVRWHLWYKGSPYSFHKGKASAHLADKYLRLAHQLFGEYVAKKNEGKN